MTFHKILLAFFVTAGCLLLSPLQTTHAYGKDSVTIAKADAKKDPKKSAKEKKSKTAAKDKTKAKTKAKTKEKGLKAKAPLAPATPKKLKPTKKIDTPTYSDRYSTSRSSSLGIWVMMGFGVILFCGICFMLWWEYRPTINASGTVYGPFEYLPAHQGGAFTTEYYDAPKNPRRHVDPNGPSGKTQPSPVTVTREPVIGSEKTADSMRAPPPSRAG